MGAFALRLRSLRTTRIQTHTHSHSARATEPYPVMVGDDGREKLEQRL